MANTGWRDRAASTKQTALIQKLADEKIIGGLDDEALDRIADVASGQSITGGEASDLIDALFKAPRKAKPSAGFAPLVSNFAERQAKFNEAKSEYEALEAAREAALAAAGGKSMGLGRCVDCGHDDHTDREECKVGRWVHLGYDSDYHVECSCKEFVEANELHEAARVAGLGIAQASSDMRHARDAMQDFLRGDDVIVVRGRKVKQGTKGQIIKTSEGTYGWSAFLKLEDGSTAWTALTNIEHVETHDPLRFQPTSRQRRR